MKIKMNRTYIDFSFAYQLRTIIMKTFSGRQLTITFTTGADIRRNLGPPGHMPIPMAHARFPWPCVFFIALAALAAQCQWVVLIAVISSAASMLTRDGGATAAPQNAKKPHGKRANAHGWRSQTTSWSSACSDGLIGLTRSRPASPIGAAATGSLGSALRDRTRSRIMVSDTADIIKRI